MPGKCIEIERTCRQCGTTFPVCRYVVDRQGANYCGRRCYHESRRVVPEVHFWTFVEKTETCWLWTGAISKGYGVFSINRKSILAHRFSYQMAYGPIPEGLELDHVKARGCTHRNCVRPDHLEAVTGYVNNMRGDGSAAMRARQTHCKNGHEFTAGNTILSKLGHRTCRACHNAAVNSRKKRLRAERRALMALLSGR